MIVRWRYSTFSLQSRFKASSNRKQIIYFACSNTVCIGYAEAQEVNVDNMEVRPLQLPQSWVVGVQQDSFVVCLVERETAAHNYFSKVGILKKDLKKLSTWMLTPEEPTASLSVVSHVAKAATHQSWKCQEQLKQQQPISGRRLTGILERKQLSSTIMMQFIQRLYQTFLRSFCGISRHSPRGQSSGSRPEERVWELVGETNPGTAR